MKTMIAGFLVYAALTLAGAAHAQTEMTQEQSDQAYCVQTQVKADGNTELVLNSFFIETSPDEVHADADRATKAAVATCKAGYGWTDEEAFHAGNVGLYSAVSDFLIAELQKGQVPVPVIMSLYGVIGGLAHGETLLMFTGSWKDDEAFVEKMHGVLVARGVPDDRMLVGVSLRVIETGLVMGSELKRFQEMRFQ